MTSSEPGVGRPDPGESDQRFTRLVLSLLAFVLIVHILDYFAVILQQFLIAALLVYVLQPVHDWLVRRGFTTSAAYAAIGLGCLGLGVVLGLVVRASLGELLVRMPEYKAAFDSLQRQMATWIPGVSERNIQALFLGQAADSGYDWINTVIRRVIDVSTQLFVVVIYLLFILAEKASFSERIRRAFPDHPPDELSDQLTTINRSVGHYIYVKTYVSVLTGVLSALALLLFGVDYAILWGVLTFLLNYIPYLGAAAAMLLPALLSLVQFQDPLYTLVIVVVLSVIQNGIGWGVEPFMTSRRVNLSPLTVILSLAVWGFLWGGVGLILAIPLTVVGRAVMEHYESTRPIARLMLNPRREP